MIPTSLLLKDPELASLAEEADMRIWLAPNRHIGAYLIVSGNSIHIWWRSNDFNHVSECEKRL